MKYVETWFHRARLGVARCLNRNFLLGGSLLVGTLGTAPAAFGTPLITYGTYISGSYYDGGVATGSYSTPGGFNYTNGIPLQQNSTGDPASPYASAASGANVANNVTSQLALSLSGSNTNTTGVAELWDTLTFGNLPSLPCPGCNLGTVNLFVNASVGTATLGVHASSNYGLTLYDTALFAPSGGDCGVVSASLSGGCTGGGAISQSSNGPG